MSVAALQHVNAIFSSLRKPQEEYPDVPQMPVVWARSCPSQDVKPSYGDINESRNETQRAHVGWRMW